VSLEAVNSSRLAQVLAPGPAEQGGELVPTSYPAPTPQTPLRTLQVARCSLGEGRLEAAGGLQCVLEPHGGVPQSSTGVAPGSTSRRGRHSPASPSHSTVAGVPAVTRATASARPHLVSPEPNLTVSAP
jgi:hypothetical protein